MGGRDNFMTLKFPSATADVVFDSGNWIGLAIGVDALRETGRSAEWQGHAGVRFGSCLAPIATLGLGLLIGATWSATRNAGQVPLRWIAIGALLARRPRIAMAMPPRPKRLRNANQAPDPTGR